MVCCTVTGRKVRRISSAHVAASRRRVDSPSKPEPGLLTAQWNRCQKGQPQVQNPPARRHQGSRRHSEGFLFWYVFVSEWFRFYIHHRKQSETKLTGTETSTRSSPLTIIVGKRWAQTNVAQYLYFSSFPDTYVVPILV